MAGSEQDLAFRAHALSPDIPQHLKGQALAMLGEGLGVRGLESADISAEALLHGKYLWAIAW